MSLSAGGSKAPISAIGSKTFAAATVVGLLFVLISPLSSVFAATLDLATILNGSGYTINLSSANTYVLSDEYRITENKVIYCHGATIDQHGPIKVMGKAVEVTFDHCHATSTSWGSLAGADGASLIVTDSSIACPAGTAIYVSAAAARLTRVDITDAQFGANIVSGGTVTASTLTVHNCPYAVQAAGPSSSVTLDETCLLEYSGSGTGIGILNGASATIGSTTITGFYVGINLDHGGPTAVEAVTINGCPYAVQATGPTSSLILSGGCSLSYDGAGTGIGLLSGAHGIVRDTTITGFSNGIDLQPPTPVGSVEVYDSHFVNNNVSAVSCVGADGIVCYHCRIEGAKADGIYFENTTGVIDRCEVAASLNTGVTFVGCSEGATLSHSTVRHSAHQGVAIAKDVDSDLPSQDIRIIANTLKNNALGDIFIDSSSQAMIVGNILAGSPGANLKLHGAKAIVCDANLIVDSDYAVEMKDQATCDLTLSHWENFVSGGILTYGGSVLTLEHSVLGPANPGAGADAYSLFLNEGATAVVNYNDMGGPDEAACYNNAGTWLEVNHNYWGSPTGPTALPTGDTESGAVIDWNVVNGSSVTYQPFLTSPPAFCGIAKDVSIAPGASWSWDSGVGLGLTISTWADQPRVNSEIVGALRAAETKHLDKIWPAPAMIEGQLYAVWIATPIRRVSDKIRLDVSVPTAAPPPYLIRRDADGFWSALPATWNPTRRLLSATLTDPYLGDGIFAVATAQPPSRSDMRDMVTHFYQTILGRDPEPGAVDAWEKGYFAYALSFDIDVRYIPTEMGRLFFLSQEYQDRHRSDAEFITDCYHAFLYRDPEPGAIDQWLSGEWNRAEAMSLFAESDEFKEYVQGLFPGFAGNGIRNLVTSLYIGLLDRLADKGGLIYWSDQFEASGNYTQMAKTLGKAFVASPEFQDFHPSEEDVVVRLYRGYLGRFPNSQEITYWAELLRNGSLTTDQLIDQFADSVEFQQRVFELIGGGALCE